MFAQIVSVDEAWLAVGKSPGMIEEGKPCLEIAQQLQAVEKAGVNAKRALIHAHVDHCLYDEPSAADRDEPKAISRYL